MEKKTCDVCFAEQPLEEFAEDAHCSDGFSRTCRTCLKEKYRLKIKKTPLRQRNKEAFARGVFKVLEEKVCGKCEELKKSDEFGRDFGRWDGLSPWCYSCNAEAAKRRYAKNAEKHRKEKKEFREKYPELVKERKHASYLRNKEHVKAKTREYRKRPGVKEHNREYMREYTKNRRKTDPVFQTKNLLSARIREALKRGGGKKAVKTIEYLGCSVLEAMEHIEQSFYPHPETGLKMCWENHDRYGWNFEHIFPIDTFDKSIAGWEYKAFHICNLQAMWYEKNYAKHTDAPTDIIWEDLYDAWVARRKNGYNKE